jgi:hypothetical protein
MYLRSFDMQVEPLTVDFGNIHFELLAGGGAVIVNTRAGITLQLEEAEFRFLCDVYAMWRYGDDSVTLPSGSSHQCKPG